MKVRIIKSEYWHKGMIGKIFNTTEPKDNGDVFVNEPTSTHHGNGLWKDDYEVVIEELVPEPAKKFVTIEDVKYEVPGWVKFVTRDGIGRNVWAWEAEPEWRGSLHGYYRNGSGKGVLVKPYVEPYVELKPEGHFIVEVA